MSVPPVTPTPVSDLTSVHTLQAYVELIFCRVANSVLVGNLEALQSSMGYTKNSIDILTQLQNLHNYAVVKEKGTFTDVFGSYTSSHDSVGNYVDEYTHAASSFYGSPVRISAYFPSGFNAFKTQIVSLEKQLSAQIILLSAVTPTLSGGGEDPNSLLAKLRIVLNDLKANNVSTQGGSINWIIDLYNAVANTDVSQSGQIQQNLTNAITAGQSLNTTQTESVRNYLYIFEEYYKAAAAVLQGITSLIQTMARNISG